MKEKESTVVNPRPNKQHMSRRRRKQPERRDGRFCALSFYLVFIFHYSAFLHSPSSPARILKVALAIAVFIFQNAGRPQRPIYVLLSVV